MTEQIEIEKYDVVYYAPEHSEKAKALVKHMSEDEAKERSITGLVPARRIMSVATQCFIPNLQPGNRKGKIKGKAIWAGRFGSNALDVKNPERHLDLKELEPGLIVGNYKPGLFETEEFIKAAEKDRIRLAANRANKLDIAEYDEDCYDCTLTYVIEEQARLCALMFGVKEKKLDGEMMKDIIQRLRLRCNAGDVNAMVLIDTWSKMNELPQDTTPDEILDDYELRAGMAASRKSVQGIWNDKTWANLPKNLQRSAHR